MILAFCNNRRISTSCESPIIEGPSHWINDLSHRANFKLLNTQSLVATTYPLHHFSNRKLHLILFGMAISLMIKSPPVEPNFTSSIVQNKSYINLILSKDIVQDNC